MSCESADARLERLQRKQSEASAENYRVCNGKQSASIS